MNEQNEMEIHYDACVSRAQDALESAQRANDPARIKKAEAELESARNMPGKPPGDS